MPNEPRGTDAMTSEVILVRHATSSHQAPEAPLSEAGFAEARALADLLGTLDIAHIVASPLLREVQTAEPFSARSCFSSTSATPSMSKLLA